MLKKTVFAGFGGQGVLMMGYVLAFSAMRDGLQVTYLPSYGAEVRGGTANCTVVVSDEEIASPVSSSPDFAVVLNRPSMMKYQGVMTSGGIMILNSSLVDVDPSRKDLDVVKVPANDIAAELGSDRTLNMIMLGAFVAKTGISSVDSVMNGLGEIVKGKNARIMELNRKGLERGAAYALREQKVSR
ncbi:MAG: 2-oxoacid:acceptor oxidoreductase family protein [Deltaproteobacteria bacterium]|nr:2-oxoacid:acceptor oxidoreductase family protein [Deltaproteobacteria bacterium]